MKTSKHEILKSKWIQNIRNQSESGLTVRDGCKRNGVTHGQYYYWLRVIREDTLIKAGTLAVTGQTEFVEIKPSISMETKLKVDNQGTCAILRSNGNEIEVLNGADPNTLETVLNLINMA